MDFLGIYESFTQALPSWAQTFITLFLLVLLVFIYSWFIWKFYRFISTKNIFGLNLNKYNKSKHPLLEKFMAGFINDFKVGPKSKQL